MSAVEKLAREILETRRLALGHATAPQLGYGSLDGGRIDFRTPDGHPIGGVGVGDDGGFEIIYVDGPKPATPTAPTVTADSGLFRVEWDGSFVTTEGEATLPTSDLDRVEVHASMDENFVPDRVQSFAGAFSSLDGGSFVFGPLPEAGTYYFRLVSRSKSKQFSVPSERVEQELAIASMDLAVTDAWLTGEAAQTTADGKNSIWRGPDEPDAVEDGPFKDGDIWFEMTEDGKSIPNIWDETTGAWVGNDDKRQSDIERVQQELREDLDAVIVDGSGTKNFYRGTMPTDEESSEGDLWFDSSDSNKPYIYQDGQWVTVRDSFAQPGVGDIAIGWGLGATRADIFDGQVTTVDGFQFGTDPDNVTVATVPSGDGSGTAKLYVPLRGTVTYDGVTVSDGRDPYDAGYPLGWSTIGNGIEGVKFKVASGAPTASLIMRAKVESTGEEMTYAYPLDISAYTTAGMTHQALSSVTIDMVMGLYPMLAICNFAILFEVPNDPGNYVRGDQVAGYSQLIEDGISDNAITETKISDDSISTPKLQSKVITTDKIATGAITAESGIIGSINAGTITVGEMEGARIKAGTVGTDKLLVGSGGNAIPTNPDPSIIDFPDLTYDSAEEAIAATRGTYYSATEFTLPAGKYRMTVDLKSSVAGDKSYIGIYHPIPRWNYGINNQATTTEWQTYTGVLEVTEDSQGYPYTIRYLPAYQSNSGGTVWMRNLRLQSMAGATLIEGGAISTEHIRTGAITAESGIIGSIDANVITVGKIMGNQLDADAVNGKTITGATVRTASSGSRVELTKNGLRQYNSLGATIVDMTSGSFALEGGTITGSTIRTATSGARIEMTETGMKQYDADNVVTFDLANGSLAMNGGYMLASGFGAGSGYVWRSPAGKPIGVSITTGTSIDSYGSIQTYDDNSDIMFEVHQPSKTMRLDGETTLNGDLLVNSDILVRTGSLTVEDSSTSNTAVDLTIARDNYGRPAIVANSRYWVGSESTTSISYETGLNNGLVITAPSMSSTDRYGMTRINHDQVYVGIGGTASSTSDGGRVIANRTSLNLEGRRVQSSSIYNTSGAKDRAVYINSTGSLGWQGSSARYKRDIEPATVSPDILDIDLKHYRYKQDVEEYEAALRYIDEIGEGPLPRHMSEAPFEPEPMLGAIAEEVHDLGVTDLVQYDAFGRPDGLAYEKFGIALIPIVRDLRDRIEELESQLAAA